MNVNEQLKLVKALEIRRKLLFDDHIKATDDVKAANIKQTDLLNKITMIDLEIKNAKEKVFEILMLEKE